MDLYKSTFNLIVGKSEPREVSEVVTHLLFGEVVSLLEEFEHWVKVKNLHDNYVYHIDRKIFETFQKVKRSNNPLFLNQSLFTLIDEKGSALHLFMGSEVSNYRDQIPEKFLTKSPLKDIENLCNTLLGSPYLWGGRTLFGIDCSGFTQIVFRVLGIEIPRDASQQAEIGKDIWGISNAQTGDLAFFHNEKSKITHVGIIFKLKDASLEIIHSSGWVRRDRLSEKGIEHMENSSLTHHLHSIRRYFD